MLIKAYSDALQEKLAELIWNQQLNTLVVAMDLTENQEEQLRQQQVQELTTSERATVPQTPGSVRPAPPNPRSTPQTLSQRLDFNSMPAWMGDLPEKQCKLFKEGKCVWCGDKYTTKHGKECPKRKKSSAGISTTMEEWQEDEEIVEENKENLDYPPLFEIKCQDVPENLRDKSDKLQHLQKYDFLTTELEIDLNTS